MVAGYNNIDFFEPESDGSPDVDSTDGIDHHMDGGDSAEVGGDSHVDGGNSADVGADHSVAGDASGMPSGPDATEPDATDGTAEASDESSDGPPIDMDASPSDATDASPSDATDASPVVIVDGPCDPFVVPDGSVNLVTDPGLEAEAADAGTNWYAANNGALFSVSSSTGHCSMHSAVVTNRTQNIHGPGYHLALTEGTYQVSIWVMQTGVGALPMGIQGVAPGCSTVYLNIAYPTISPNTWTHVTGTLTVPTGCTTVSVQVVQTAKPNTPGGPSYPDIYADEFYVLK
jgi:hypothetical protein